MATRATYQFQDKEGIIITYYCPWDGYLEGAAQYFDNMRKASSKRNNLAARFLIGNPDQAEFTHSHNSHGDTEYRYTISKDDILTASHLVNWENKEFKTVFHGEWRNFIDLYLKRKED